MYCQKQSVTAVLMLHRGSNSLLAGQRVATQCAAAPLAHANQIPLLRLQSAASLESDSCKQTYCSVRLLLSPLYNSVKQSKKAKHSAFVARALHGIQTTLKRSGMDHTAFNLQRTPCQLLARKRSPDGASTECGGNI